MTGFCLAYGDRVVLDDVVLDPAAGELVVLTGEDGCGTTSLLRLLAGRLQDGRLLEAPPGGDWSDGDVVTELGGLEHLAGRQMWTLSGGERQRVRLAQVLDARVLLLDDGLGYLDGAGVRWALERLRAHADAGGSVVLVAKGDERAYAAADRVQVLEGGRLRPLP